MNAMGRECTVGEAKMEVNLEPDTQNIESEKESKKAQPVNTLRVPIWRMNYPPHIEDLYTKNHREDVYKAIQNNPELIRKLYKNVKKNKLTSQQLNQIFVDQNQRNNQLIDALINQVEPLYRNYAIMEAWNKQRQIIYEKLESNEISEFNPLDFGPYYWKDVFGLFSIECASVLNITSAFAVLDYNKNRIYQPRNKADAPFYDNNLQQGYGYATNFNYDRTVNMDAKEVVYKINRAYGNANQVDEKNKLSAPMRSFAGSISASNLKNVFPNINARSINVTNKNVPSYNKYNFFGLTYSNVDLRERCIPMAQTEREFYDNKRIGGLIYLTLPNGHGFNQIFATKDAIIKRKNSDEEVVYKLDTSKIQFRDANSTTRNLDEINKKRCILNVKHFYDKRTAENSWETPNSYNHLVRQLVNLPFDEINRNVSCGQVQIIRDDNEWQAHFACRIKPIINYSTDKLTYYVGVDLGLRTLFDVCIVDNRYYTDEKYGFIENGNILFVNKNGDRLPAKFVSQGANEYFNAARLWFNRRRNLQEAASSATSNKKRCKAMKLNDLTDQYSHRLDVMKQEIVNSLLTQIWRNIRKSKDEIILCYENLLTLERGNEKIKRLFKSARDILIQSRYIAKKVELDPKYTSQRCPHCGYINQYDFSTRCELRNSNRHFECIECLLGCEKTINTELKDRVNKILDRECKDKQKKALLSVRLGFDQVAAFNLTIPQIEQIIVHQARKQGIIENDDEEISK